MRMSNDEKGMVIVEASFVFPIMFFVLFFLIFMGNTYFLRSRVDSVVNVVAIKGASLCQDPLLKAISESGSVPLENSDITPYRYVIGGMDSVEKDMNEELTKQIGLIGNGFFTDMSPQVLDSKVKYDNHIFYYTFTVEVSYKISYPMRFIGSDKPTIVEVSSKAVVPITDTAEFIGNVDMAIDYYESSGVKEKVEEVVGKAKEFIGKFKK